MTRIKPEPAATISHGATPPLAARTPSSNNALQPFASKLLKVVSSKQISASEKLLFRRPRLARCISQFRELNSANVVRELEEAIRRRIGISILNSMLRNRLSQRSVQSSFHNLLPIVVIHLDQVEALKELKVFRNENPDIALQPLPEMHTVTNLPFAVWKCLIQKGHFVHEVGKCIEERFAPRRLNSVKRSVAPQYGREMKRSLPPQASA